MADLAHHDGPNRPNRTEGNQMTTSTDITDRQIVTLRRDAEEAGDLAMAMICVRALGDDLADAEPGTDGADAREMSVEAAREECARALHRQQPLPRLHLTNPFAGGCRY